MPVTLEHVPGAIAKVSRTLANAGVSIEFSGPTGQSGDKTIVALGVDREDPRRALGGQVTGSYGELWPKALAGAKAR